MQDFYRTYEGGRASTADFRRVVEQHTGADMGWFFDQWIYGTAIPTYKVATRTERMGDGQFRVRLQVQQEDVPRASWPTCRSRWIWARIGWPGCG